MSCLYIVMGPAGSGKSTIGEALANRMNWTMVEGDAHHPQENVDKQASGLPLTDHDRANWLDSMIAHINTQIEGPVVLACSALTPYVQGRLRDEIDRRCVWLLLEVPKDVLATRLTARTDHFMPASLLDDQLKALAPPSDVIRISAHQSVVQICDTICDRLEAAQNG